MPNTPCNMTGNKNEQLIHKAKKALQQHAPAIKSADIFVSIDTVVVLKGVVDTPQERDKAVAIVRKQLEAEHVHVRSELKVMSEQDQTDPALQKEPHPGYPDPGDDQGCSPSGRVG